MRPFFDYEIFVGKNGFSTKFGFGAKICGYLVILAENSLFSKVFFDLGQKYFGGDETGGLRGMFRSWWAL